MLNYQDIKIFNKNGYEIPLVSTSNIIFTTANSLDMISDNDILLYGYYNNVDKTKFSTKTIKPGKLNKDLYNTAISSGIKLYAFVDEKLANETTLSLSENNFIKLYYTDNTEYNYSDDTLTANGKDEFLYYTLDTNISIDINIDLSSDKNGNEILLTFPSAIFFANIDFEKVSVGLVETETLIFGNVDRENNELIYKPLVDNDINGYDLKLLINGDNSELAFLSYDNISEEINKHNEDFIPCNAENKSQYSNIGFFPDKEGVFENVIHICLVKRDTDDIIPIGQLNVICVAEGEDERYNALLANFGLQHPKTYHNIFKSQDINEANIDWNLINYKAKELFLSYDQIFPYVGTYKALVNAIEYLGYDDIYFREWYKILKNDKKISYRIDLNDIFDERPLNNDPLNIKKLNQLSMVYKINSETGEYDEFNIPIVKNCYTYSITSVLTKLIALRDWLHRNIISVNCKIVDISGEGVVYERVDHITYGTIMQNIDHEEIIELSPRIKNRAIDLIDGSANIEITTLISSSNNFIQLCDIADDAISSFDDRSTIEHPYIYDFYSKCVVDTSNAILKDNVTSPIWINDGQMYLTDRRDNMTLELNALTDDNENQLYNDDNKLYATHIGYYNTTSNFINPPIIQLEHGFLRNKTDVWNNNIEYTIIDSNSKRYSYTIFDASGNTYQSNDYIILYPGEGAELRYTLDNIYEVPMLILKNYKIICYNFETGKYGTQIKNLPNNIEYILDIRDGKIINKTDKLIYSINFNYEYNRENKQNVSVVYEYLNHHTYENASDIYKNIKVEHQGHYGITIYAYKNGNVYAKEIEGGCDVKMPTSNIKLLTDSSYYENSKPYHFDEIVYGRRYNNLKIDEYYDNEYPIFRPNYPISELIFNNDNNSIVYNNITYANDIAKKNDYLHFINNLDKVKPDKYNNGNITFSFKMLRNIYPFIKNNENVENDINLTIYNKLLCTGIKEFQGKLVSLDKNTNTIEIKFRLDDYTTIEYLSQNVYNDDYNIEYYINPIGEYKIENVTLNDNKTTTFKIVSNTNNIEYFKSGDIIKIVYTLSKYADAECYRSINDNKIIHKWDNEYDQITYNDVLGGYFDNSNKQYYKLYKSDDYDEAYNGYATFKVLSANNETITVDGEFRLKNYNKTYVLAEIDSNNAAVPNNLMHNNNYYYVRYEKNNKKNLVTLLPDIEIIDNGNTYFTTDIVLSARVAHAHQAYTKYVLTSKNSAEFSNGTSTVHINNNRIFNYLDNSFSFIISKFNHLNAFNLWNYNKIETSDDPDDLNYVYDNYNSKVYIGNDTSDFAYIDDNILFSFYINRPNNDINTYNRTYEYAYEYAYEDNNATMYINENKDDLAYINKVPSSDKHINLYLYDKPITMDKSKDNILYIMAESTKFDTIKTYWKLYKQNVNNNTRTLVFEVMNNILQLQINSPGVYDIEAYSYDSNGNLSVSKREAMIYIK